MSDAALSFLLAAGGGLGACARHAVSELLVGERALRWSLATLWVNLAGSLLLGAATVLVVLPSGSVAEILLIGFCGGFTTFSSFAWQTRGQYRQRGALAAVANVVLNLGGCLLAFAAGLRLAGLA